MVVPPIQKTGRGRAPADNPHVAGPDAVVPVDPAVDPTSGHGGRSGFPLPFVLLILGLAGAAAGLLAWAVAGPDPGLSGPAAVVADGSDPGATGSDPEAAVDSPAAPVAAVTTTSLVPVSVVPGSVVTVAASQATVIVAGVVPSQAVAEELVGRAAALYAPDQVQNQLAVDPTARSPIVVGVTGTTTDRVLFDRLASAFIGIVGIDTIDTAGLSLDEPSELEAALAALPSIQFAPATADMLPESLPVLDQMTALLAAAPGTAIEIGAHTDTRGSAEANRALSQARADAVLTALAGRGLVNPMVARGFGESRPAVTPDETPEAQAANRRVELRVL